MGAKNQRKIPVHRSDGLGDSDRARRNHRKCGCRSSHCGILTNRSRHGDVARLPCTAHPCLNGHTRACIQRILNCGSVCGSRSGIIGSEYVRRAGIERAVRICQRNVHICRIQQPKTSLSANGRCNNRPKRLEIVFTGGFHKTSISPFHSAPGKDFTVKPGVLIRPKDHFTPIPIPRRIRPNHRIGSHHHGLGVGDFWILTQIVPSHQHRPAPGFPRNIHLRLN